MNDYPPDEAKKKAAVIQAINSIIDNGSNHWGRIEPDGRVIAFEKEEPAMVGESAEQFKRQSFEARHKYNPVIDALHKLIDQHGLVNPKIADVGSGPGILTQRIVEEIRGAQVLGFDISCDMVKMAQARATRENFADRATFIEMDAAKVSRHYEKVGEKPDIVVSRNMLHRVPNIKETLLTLSKTAKEKGGIVYIVSFLNPKDFSLNALRHLLEGVNKRAEFPVLQKAWTLAYLNAPTLEQYQKAVYAVEQEIHAEHASAESDGNTYVNILIEKAD